MSDRFGKAVRCPKEIFDKFRWNFTRRGRRARGRIIQAVEIFIADKHVISRKPHRPGIARATFRKLAVPRNYDNFVFIETRIVVRAYVLVPTYLPTYSFVDGNFPSPANFPTSRFAGECSSRRRVEKSIIHRNSRWLGRAPHGKVKGTGRFTGARVLLSVSVFRS